MARWEPGARGRLMAAALDLYGERGFEQTTALEIAERAGVTERTFYRHFADKREVLFAGSSVLQETVVTAIGAAESDANPVDIVAGAFVEAATLIDGDRSYSRKRGAVITANPSLLERESLKMATLSAAASEALRARGVPEPAASLAADTGVTVFKVGFYTWISTDTSMGLGQCIGDALAHLRGLTA